MISKPLKKNGFQSSSMLRFDGTTAPARTGDPQIHKFEGLRMSI